MVANSVEILIKSQLEKWELAKRNYEGLSSVRTREVLLDGFSMNVQFNPERMRSSAAKVDPKSIAERKCFLCSGNLPKEQRGVPYQGKYTLLVNPFPIFHRHLTIPDTAHVDQRINGRMGDMLSLARDLESFVIFYNGPKCGASAPDHFHFQAGSKGMLPIEKDFLNYLEKTVLLQSVSGNIYEMNNYARKALIYESPSSDWLVQSFESLLKALEKMQSQEEEPLLNILASFDGGCWRLFVFPRTKHRPSQFFEEGDKQVLFSPASVDMGGLLIVPRESDFLKFDKALIEDMFLQITFSDGLWSELKMSIL